MTPLKTFQNLSRDKQNRIISAAVAEFSEKGYAGASINAIVEQLGIAKGSIFQYFGDKERLFRFVFEAAMSTVKDYLRTARDETADEALPIRLEATLVAGIRFLQAHPRIYRLYLRIRFEYQIPFRDELLRSLRQYSLDYLRSLLETARDRGELRSGLDLDRASFMLDALMDRFLQAQTVPDLDAGLGLYKCSEAEARHWAADLVEMVRTGIGCEGTVP